MKRFILPAILILAFGAGASAQVASITKSNSDNPPHVKATVMPTNNSVPVNPPQAPETNPVSPGETPSGVPSGTPSGTTGESPVTPSTPTPQETTPTPEPQKPVDTTSSNPNATYGPQNGNNSVVVTN